MFLFFYEVWKLPWVLFFQKVEYIKGIKKGDIWPAFSWGLCWTLFYFIAQSFLFLVSEVSESHSFLSLLYHSLLQKKKLCQNFLNNNIFNIVILNTLDIVILLKLSGKNRNPIIHLPNHLLPILTLDDLMYKQRIQMYIFRTNYSESRISVEYNGFYVSISEERLQWDIGDQASL